MTIHGVLVEIFGIGVLLLGESGIGKSETALELVRRGHKLVADDTADIALEDDRVVGQSPELTFEIIEIRGLGILNIRELFGPLSVARKVDIALCIELVETEHAGEIDRIGLEMAEHLLMGLAVPKFVLPVSPGRSLATLIETAVRVFILRRSGVNAASDLVDRHSDLVRDKA